MNNERPEIFRIHTVAQLTSVMTELKRNITQEGDAARRQALEQAMSTLELTLHHADRLSDEQLPAIAAWLQAIIQGETERIGVIINQGPLVVFDQAVNAMVQQKLWEANTGMLHLRALRDRIQGIQNQLRNQVADHQHPDYQTAVKAYLKEESVFVHEKQMIGDRAIVCLRAFGVIGENQDLQSFQDTHGQLTNNEPISCQGYFDDVEIIIRQKSDNIYILTLNITGNAAFNLLANDLPDSLFEDLNTEKQMIV